MRLTLLTLGTIGVLAGPTLAQSQPSGSVPGPTPKTLPSPGMPNPTPNPLPPLKAIPTQSPAPLKATIHEPAQLPAGVGASQDQKPIEEESYPGPDLRVKLPQKENLTRIDATTLMSRRGASAERWQVTNGTQIVREFASGQNDAEEYVRLLRDLKANAWGTIGTDRTVVEYGLRDEKAASPAFSPKSMVNIDPKSVRVESVRGVWVLRDDANILLNFGKNQNDADQAFGVIRKYKFNRLGQVGPTNSGMTVLFFQPHTPRTPYTGANQYSELARYAQEQQLTRTGFDVPSSGDTGEKITIDPKVCEIRREKGHWVLAHGLEVLADFGTSEWSARDALKLVQEQRFTEFCRFNADITFFLTNGQPPTRVPFAVQAVRFDKESLVVKGASSGKFGVYEGMGRLLFTCEAEKEAKQLLTVLKHYGFDTSCQMGLSGKNSLKFLAKTGR
jgi:hypothetical protein